MVTGSLSGFHIWPPLYLSMTDERHLFPAVCTCLSNGKHRAQDLQTRLSVSPPTFGCVLGKCRARIGRQHIVEHHGSSNLGCFEAAHAKRPLVTLQERQRPLSVNAHICLQQWRQPN